MNDENVTITAIISSSANSEIKVRKDFLLKVKAALSADEILDGALAKITAESVTSQKQLVADLNLPSTTAEGYAVTWESLSKEYISNDGIINKSINIANPTKVDFKVTVSTNGVSKSKNITFTVAKRGADVILTPADIAEPIGGVVTYKATVSDNGTAYLRDSNGNNIIGFAVNDSKLSVDYKNTDFAQFDVNDKFEISVVMNTIDRCASVYVDGKVILDYVPYLTVVEGFKNVVKNGLVLTNEKVIFDEYSLFDYNIKLFDYLDALENIYVAENRTLKTDAIGGVDVKWTSSDEIFMTNSGEFKSPSNIGFFDMSFEMTVNGGSGAKYYKNISCVAVPAEDDNLMNGSKITSNISESAENDKTKVNDGDITTYYAGKELNDKKYITIELDKLKEINSLYFFQNNGEGIRSCDIYLSTDGIVWGEVVASPVFTDLNSNFVLFDYQDAKYVKIANIVAENNQFKIYEIKGYIGHTAGNKAQFDIAALDMPADYNLKVTSINLPRTGSVYGSKLTWTSTKPNVISTDGKVTKSNVATEVVLTVIAEFEGMTATKKFTYLVPGEKSGATGGSGGGAGGGGSISGVNAGGASISATPTTPEVELEKTEVSVSNNGIFADTPADAWYYDYLTGLVEKGIVNGYDDGKFMPNNHVTREEFLKMLIVTSGIELTYNNKGFADVDEDAWYTPYIYTAKENGIVSGVDENNFGIGMNISRQDMAVMVYNILKNNVEMSYDDSLFTELFADDNSISGYAYTNVYMVKKLGILNGYENGEFRPNGNLTRAEAVKVISLILEML